MALYYEVLPIWIKQGIEENANYLLIVKDLEDQEYFPVYFIFLSDCEKYRNNIISESKLKVIALFRLSNYQDS